METTEENEITSNESIFCIIGTLGFVGIFVLLGIWSEICVFDVISMVRLTQYTNKLSICNGKNTCFEYRIGMASRIISLINATICVLGYLLYMVLVLAIPEAQYRLVKENLETKEKQKTKWCYGTTVTLLVFFFLLEVTLLAITNVGAVWIVCTDITSATGLYIGFMVSDIIGILINIVGLVVFGACVRYVR